MSAQATTVTGGPVLRVHVNYILVYPVEPPRAPADWMRIVAHFDGSVDFGNWTDARTPFEPWWQANPSAAGGRCAMPDGYVHPEFPSGPPGKVQPSGAPIDPYSMSDQSAGSCRASKPT
jgi:hypothetical protein